MTTKTLGIPKTIGELKKLIENYSDETSFGFRNQPMQMLVETHGEFVVFQDTEESVQFKCEKWNPLSETMPIPEVDGEKVLLFRIMNDGQKPQGISIHETSLVKHCEPSETWWMRLPNKPIN